MNAPFHPVCVVFLSVRLANTVAIWDAHARVSLCQSFVKTTSSFLFSLLYFESLRRFVETMIAGITRFVQFSRCSITKFFKATVKMLPQSTGND